MLYDTCVVSEDGFFTWEKTDDPYEREGKTWTLKSLISFLTWLKEAEPESDQDAE
jgi:eIF4-gamma/eIF5/eIF2-epsilon